MIFYGNRYTDISECRVVALVWRVSVTRMGFTGWIWDRDMGRRLYNVTVTVLVVYPDTVLTIMPFVLLIDITSVPVEPIVGRKVGKISINLCPI